MKRRFKFLPLILVLNSFLGFGQSRKWSHDEKEMHINIKSLCDYVVENKGRLSKDTLFQKYIYFDYILNDTLESRRDSRIKSFDTLFYPFRHYLDSIGLENLDAKPIRFFKRSKIYKPFKNYELKKLTPDVFVYYFKSSPKVPRGTLFIDRKTKKLVAWILINQGGYYYYLTFNLL